MLVAGERTGQALDWVPGKGRSRANSTGRLLPRLERDVLLVTDAPDALLSAAIGVFNT